MATLQIRDLDDAVYEALSEKAKREHRSLAQQAALTLAEALDVPVGGCARRRSLLQLIEVERGERWPADLPAPADLVREDRER